jgi:acetolactate synthase regulatory subunit
MSEPSARGTVPAPHALSVVPKVPRERLIRLDVEADLCPQVLLRVLGLVAQQWLIPLTITARSASDSIAIEVELDGAALSAERAEVLLYKIEAIVSVREARLTAP